MLCIKKLAWLLSPAILVGCGSWTSSSDALGLYGDATRGTGGLGGGGGARLDGGTGAGGAGAGGVGFDGGTGSGGARFDGGTGDGRLDAGLGGIGAGGAGAIDALGAVDAPMDMDAFRMSIDGATDARELDSAAVVVCGPFATGGAPGDAGAVTSPLMSFFVTSLTSVTGNLGGLAGADQRCQNLAQAAGLPSPLWRAYLSVEHNPVGTGPSVNARDRIGTGPWYNARGALLASDLTSLHARKGDPSVFLDEQGKMINGQWTGSPSPVEHDILTGSNPDGTVAFGKTCEDWTSATGPSDGGILDGGGGLVARVGHSDGFGPQCSVSTSPVDYTSWNSAHDNAGCDNTEPLGGAGRIYCFKANQ